MSKSLRLSIIQCTPLNGTRNEDIVSVNMTRLEHAVKQAVADNSDIIVFPEMFLTGYNIGKESLALLAQYPYDPAGQKISQIAAENSIAIAYGYPEKTDDNTIYNSVQLFDARGESISHYRKTHLYGDLDRSQFAPSNQAPTVVSLCGWSIGILICYDIEFPEIARHLALCGADLIIVPTANMVPYDNVSKKLLPARAIENQVYIGYANYIGREITTEHSVEYCGCSCIISPKGDYLAYAQNSSITPNIITATIYHEQLEYSRRVFTYLQDREPTLYQKLVE